jgi:hypothetical protein
MKRDLGILLVAVLWGLTAVVSGQVFDIPLSPEQEAHVVDSDASGKCLAYLDQDLFEIICAHTVQGATAAHIHRAAAGVSGPIILPFESPVSPFRGTFELSSADRADLLAGNLYVNVHSAAYPAGEVRGQIGPRADSAVFFPLEAEQETVQVDSDNVGHCMAVLNPLNSAFTIACSHTVADAIGIHIHQAPAGEDGPIVFNLAPGTTNNAQVYPGTVRFAVDTRGTPGSEHGPVVFSFHTATTLLDQATPGDGRFDETYRFGDFLDALWWENLYVNVHSPAYPGGELRGQIPRPGLVQYFPQFGNGGGAALEGGFSSSVVLTNPSSSAVAHGTMYFYDPDGEPLSVGLLTSGLIGPSGILLQSAPVTEVEFAIEPLGSVGFTTDGLGELIIGSAEVIANEPIGGIIRFRHPEIGISGFGSAPPLRGAITPVRRNFEINTAIAVRNNETFPINVTLEMRDEEGGELGQNAVVQRQIPPDGRLAQFINELFEDLDTTDIVGTVVISTAEGSFSAIALELGLEPGLFTSLPVTPVEVP